MNGCGEGAWDAKGPSVAESSTDIRIQLVGDMSSLILPGLALGGIPVVASNKNHRLALSGRLHPLEHLDQDRRHGIGRGVGNPPQLLCEA